MRWEYRQVKLTAATGRDGERVDPELVRLGDDGWEAVGLASPTSGSVVVLLKRPVAE